MKYLGKKSKISYSLKNGRSIDVIDNPHSENPYLVSLATDEFTALCPVTHQPDFAEIIITYIPDALLVESKSLKLYLMSFRNTGMFHEAIVNKIADDIHTRLQSQFLLVQGRFKSRGGIMITVKTDRGDRALYKELHRL